MSKLQELREQQEVTKAEIHKLRDAIAERRKSGKSGSQLLEPEERSKFDTLSAEFKARKAEIETEERADHVVAFLEQEAQAEERSRRGAGGRLDPLPGDKLPGEDDDYGSRFGGDRGAARRFALMEERKVLAIAAWARYGRFAATDEERSACHELKFDHTTKEITFEGMGAESLKKLRRATAGWHGEDRSRRAHAAMRYAEERSIGSANRTNLVPQVMVSAFEQAVVSYGGIYNAADVMVSDSAAQEAWPTGDDTSNEGRQVNDPAAVPTAGVDPSFGKLLLAGYDFTSDFVKVGNTTLRDTTFDLAAIVGGMLGERLVKIVNRKGTVGSGSGTLKGIASYNVVYGVDMADNETFIWQELVKLKHSLDSRFRDSGTFMLNDDILLQYMLQVDDQNRPIIMEANGDTPGRLLNRPFEINNHMMDAAAVAAATDVAGGVAVLFGNLKAYKLKLIGQVRSKRLEERFIEDDQTGFIAFRSADGGLLNPGDNPVKALGVKKAA